MPSQLQIELKRGGRPLLNCLFGLSRFSAVSPADFFFPAGDSFCFSLCFWIDFIPSCCRVGGGCAAFFFSSPLCFREMGEAAEEEGDGEKGRTRAGEVISGTGPSRVLRFLSAGVVFSCGVGEMPNT